MLPFCLRRTLPLLPITLLATPGLAQLGGFKKLPSIPPHGGLGHRPWVATFGGGGFDAVDAVVDAPGGGYFVAGHTRSLGAGDSQLWVARLGPRGTVGWELALGGKGDDQGRSLLATADGGCLVAGLTASFGAGGDDGWLVKLDSTGAVEWQRAYGSPGLDSFSSVDAFPGGYYVGGSMEVKGGGNDAWILAVDPAGDVLWQETFGEKGDDRLRSLTATPDGVAFTADSSSSLTGANVPFFRPWLVRLDAAGAPLWQRTFDFSGGDSWNHLVAVPGGGFVVTGEILAAAFFRGDLWVVRLDDLGNIVWDQRLGDHFGNLGWDAGLQVWPTAGGFVVAGSTETAAASSNFWALGFDAAGTFLGDQLLGGPSFDVGTCMTPPRGGVSVLGGYAHSYGAGSADGLLAQVALGEDAPKGCDLSGPTGASIWSSALTIAAPTLAPVASAVVPVDTDAKPQALDTQSFVCAPR